MYLLINSNQSRQLLAILLMCLFFQTAEANVSASLDHNPATEGDQIVLTIRQDGPGTGSKPDLKPLQQDFEILGNNQSSQVSIINGRRSDLTAWSISLLPRHLGTIHIGPIHIGKEQTAPLTLEVKQASAWQSTTSTPQLFLEMSTDRAKDSHYVQQEIPVTVRLFYRNRLQQGTLDSPKPDNTVVERLGDDKQYSTVRKTQQYNVIERHYAIFPEKSGSFTIPPIVFRGRISVPQAPNQRGQGFHAPFGQAFPGNNLFANDPFFANNFFRDNPFGTPGKPVAVRSNSLTLVIKPRPQSYTGDAWLPAQSVTLQDSWAKQLPEFRVGDPVSRTITIQAKGLEASQIPPLELPQPPGFRLYTNPAIASTRTDGNNVYGSSKRTYTYIPEQAGRLVVPEYRLNWWNTRRKKQDQTLLEKWQLSVLASTAAPTLRATTPTTATDSSSTLVPEPQATTEIDLKTRHRWLNILLLIILAAGIVWLLWRHGAKLLQLTSRASSPGHKIIRNAASNNPATAKPHTLRRSVKKACEQNDPQATADALLALAADHWPDTPPRSLGTLAKRLDQGSVEILTLEHALYAATGTAWKGDALWQVLKHGFNNCGTAKPKRYSRGILPPLYPE